MCRKKMFALSLLLALCLAMAFAATAWASEGGMTLTVGPSTIVAGTTLEKVTLTMNNPGESHFEETISEYLDGSLTIDGADVGASGAFVSSCELTDTYTVAILTLSGCTPTKQGTLTIHTGKASIIPDSNLTATITVDPAPTPTIEAAASGLRVYKEGGTVTLTIQEPTNNTFAASLQPEYFTVNDNGAGLSRGGIERDPGGKSVTLTLTGTPSTQGPVTIEISKEAFAFQPGDGVSTDPITIQAPDITAVVSGSLIQGVAGTVTVNAKGTFADQEALQPDHFTLRSGTVTGVTRTGNTNVALTVTPTALGDLEVTRISADAFQVKPETDLAGDKIEGKATVFAPTGTVTAAMQGGDLYVGTPVKETQKLTLTIGGRQLRYAQPQPQAGDFKLSDSGLKVDAVSAEGDVATLTLSGTPASQGKLTVTAETSAFLYPPQSGEALSDATSIDIQPAPSVTVNSAQPPLTAGMIGQTLTLFASGSKFASPLQPEWFTFVGEAADGMRISGVGAGGTNNAAITLDPPTKTGTVQIQIDPQAFDPRPDGPVTSGTITVEPPGGTISALLSPDNPQAGRSAFGITVTLTINGTLTFKKPPSRDDFLLGDGDTGLAVYDVEGGGDTVTLTLFGTPKAAGDVSILVKTSAFLAPPEPDQPINAGPIIVRYPTIILTSRPTTVAEGHTDPVLTLTVEGSAFKAAAGDAGFAVTGGPGSAGLRVKSVTAAEGSDTATLALSGTPTDLGTVEVTIPKEAFVYQPQDDKIFYFIIGTPEGKLSASLEGGEIRVGTPVSGQRIQLTEVSGDLHFRQTPATEDFLLGDGSDGLSIAKVERLDDHTAALVLSGTPGREGTFTVTAKKSAFQYAPADDVLAEQTISVGAPAVSLAVKASTLTAGTEGGSFTLTAAGSAFISDVSGLVSVAGGGTALGEMKLAAVTVRDGAVLVTLSGMPQTAGTVRITVSKDAFQPAPKADVTVEVPVARGTCTAQTDVPSGAPGLGFASPTDKLAAAILDDDEQALYAAGAQVLFQMEERDITATVSAADKAAVAAAAPDYTAGVYLDVTLYKTINDGTRVPVTETSAPIRVVFTIPESLRAADRQFAIVRVHDGKATMLKTVASTSTTIVVESDLFSTYAIVYRTAPDSGSSGGSGSDSSDQNDSAPDTGDSTALLAWTAVVLGGGAALVPAVSALRRKGHRG